MQQQHAQSGGHPAMTSCLIVEDSEFDSLRMQRVLTKSLGEVPVEVASTLSRARKVLGEKKLGLILLDNNLPDGLGANFALEVSKDPRLSHVPIIIISDWPSPFMWEKAASAGVLYVLNKSEFDGRYVHAALKAARQRRAKVN